MKAVLLQLAFLFFWALPLHAVEVELPGEVGRGEPFWVELKSQEKPLGIKVSWMDNIFAVPVDLPGTQKILLGAGLERQGEYPLELKFYWEEHQKKERYQVQVKDKEYPEQHISLPEEMVTPPEEVWDRIAREREKLGSVLSSLTMERYWDGDFARPVSGEISSPFGVQRYLNGEPRSAHKGVDLRGDKGTQVSAAAKGRVVLIGNFYFGGKTVVLDHGQGIYSLYMHLNSVRVRENEFVEQNQAVGEVGMTGRATGPHLHLGVYVLGEPVDPMYLLNAE